MWLSWPADGELKLPLSNEITGVTLLADPGFKAEVTQSEGYAVINLPVQSSDTLLPVIKLEIEGTPAVVPPVSSGKTTTASSIDSLSPVS
ncbi:MAG: hypothetical protein MZV64_48390 [Ignavibacteriales bacterium]|nr:hypothetical protein [Ignavibacteriales bacterium]